MRLREAVAIIAVASIIPIVTSSPYWLHVMILGGVYAILAAGWDLIAGYSGQLSFAHAAFYGIGAYASALLSLHGMSPWIALPTSFVIAMLLGALVALPCSRLTGHYIAIWTMSFNLVVWIIADSWVDVTRGSLGLYGYPPFPGLPYTKVAYYYLMLSLLTITILTMYKVVNSRVGLVFQAIRDNEELAQSLGINTVKYRVAAFALGSGFAGLAGSFVAYFLLLVSPETAEISVSVFVVAISVIGGLGTMIGPIIFGFGLIFLTEYFRVVTPYLRLLTIGLSLIIAVKFFPRGLVPLIGDLKSALLRRGRGGLVPTSRPPRKA